MSVRHNKEEYKLKVEFRNSKVGQSKYAHTLNNYGVRLMTIYVLYLHKIRILHNTKYKHIPGLVKKKTFVCVKLHFGFPLAVSIILFKS